MSGKVEDKKGNPIEVGDTLFTKIRGGKREAEVTIPVDHRAIRVVAKL
jgi:predicted HAD superfamily phosphohydrolase YqeG